MRAPQLSQLIEKTDRSILAYGALRKALLEHLPGLKNLPGGPWRIEYKRDPSEGDLELHPQWSVDVASVTEFAGQPFTGSAIIHVPETYAPFKEFRFLDADGNSPQQTSEAFKTEMTIEFLLTELLSAVKSLVDGLAAIETISRTLQSKTDLSPLIKLRVQMPPFPYWPDLRLPAERYAELLEVESSIIEKARSVLQAIGQELRSAEHSPPPAQKMMPLASTNFSDGSYGRTLQRIAKDADAMMAACDSEQSPDSAKARALMTQALDSSIGIAKMSRTSKAISTAEFIQRFIWLEISLDLFEKVKDVIQKWPEMPGGVSLSWKHSRSALEVTLEFANMIRVAALYGRTRAIGILNGQPPVDLQVESSAPDAPAQLWRDATIEEIREHTLPTLPFWPMHEIHADHRRVQICVDQEYESMLRNANPGNSSIVAIGDLLKWAGYSSLTLCIVFSDIVGSTELRTRLGNQKMKGLVENFVRVARELTRDNRGWLVKTVGDEVMSVFHNATDAFRFAAQLHRHPFENSFLLRTGINSGNVWVGNEDIDGQAVNVAKRVQTAAGEDEIWISDPVKQEMDGEIVDEFAGLHWTSHSDCELKGLGEKRRLWSTSPTK